VPGSPEAEQLFAILIKHHIAITSTLVSSANVLPTFGTNAEGQPALRPAVRDAMAPALQQAYDYWLKRPPSKRNVAFFLRREMDLERAFVAAGGLLLTGPDPGGIAGNLPGFGDHCQIELLVEAGFTPVQAIRIATLNGAIFLGREKQIGSVAVGKNADLLVVKGDPVSRIADIEDVEIVFKDGVGYDPKKLLDSVKGHYGEY
jgi:hypothetical protein